MGTAQKVVEDEAKKAGYTRKAWHRTNDKFNEFSYTKIGTNQGKSLGDGFYVALRENSEYDTPAYGKTKIALYVRSNSPFKLIDALTEKQAQTV